MNCPNNGEAYKGSNNVYIAGYTSTAVASGIDYIVVKYSQGSTSVFEETSADNSVVVFPNPFFSTVSLQTNNPFHNATLTVYNSHGQTVKQIKNINGHTVVLSRDNLATGLYFIRLTEENKIIAADKLVITDK